MTIKQCIIKLSARTYLEKSPQLVLRGKIYVQNGGGSGIQTSQAEIQENRIHKSETLLNCKLEEKF